MDRAIIAAQARAEDLKKVRQARSPVFQVFSWEKSRANGELRG